MCAVVDSGVAADNKYFDELFPPLSPPPVALRPNAGRGLLMLEVSRSHTTTHHSR